MKKKTTFIIETVKIIINCITVPLYFIKIFCDEALLPGFNEDGQEIIGRFYYYYSIFDKIDREDMAFLIWGAIAIAILSIALSVLSMTVKNSKALKIASNVVFGAAIAFFFVLLFVAGSIRYGY